MSTDQNAESYARTWAALTQDERDELWTLAIETGRPSEPLWRRLTELGAGVGPSVVTYWDESPENATEQLMILEDFRNWLLGRRGEPGFPK